MNPAQYYNKPLSQQAPPNKIQKEFIIKKASPTQTTKTKIFQGLNDLQVTNKINVDNLFQAPFKEEKKTILQRPINAYQARNDVRPLNSYVPSCFNGIGASSNFLISQQKVESFNKTEKPGSRTLLSRGISVELEEKANNKYEEERRKREEKEFILKSHLDEVLNLLDQSRRQNERLQNDLKVKDIKIKELDEENLKLKKKLIAQRSRPTPTTNLNIQNRNSHSNNHSNNRNVIGRFGEEQQFEETKTDHDDAEIRSLQLALRLEAENMLLSHFTQLAGIRHQYQAFDPNESINLQNVNPDNMTYEQLLQLEEKMGSVSKGLTKEEIKQIPKAIYDKVHNINEDKCSVCYCEFELGDKLKKLSCTHQYHSKCIKPWLTNEKNCPICKKEIIII